MRVAKSIKIVPLASTLAIDVLQDNVSRSSIYDQTLIIFKTMTSSMFPSTTLPALSAAAGSKRPAAHICQHCVRQQSARYVC